VSGAFVSSYKWQTHIHLSIRSHFGSSSVAILVSSSVTVFLQSFGSDAASTECASLALRDRVGQPSLRFLRSAEARFYTEPLPRRALYSHGGLQDLVPDSRR
jgi:hypothetical protein